MLFPTADSQIFLNYRAGTDTVIDHQMVDHIHLNARNIRQKLNVLASKQFRTKTFFRQYQTRFLNEINSLSLYLCSFLHGYIHTMAYKKINSYLNKVSFKFVNIFHIKTHSCVVLVCTICAKTNLLKICFITKLYLTHAYYTH